MEEIEEISFPQKVDSLNLLIKIDESIDIIKFKKILNNKSLHLIDLNKFTYKKNGKENYFILGFANLSIEEIDQGIEIIKFALKNSKNNFLESWFYLICYTNKKIKKFFTKKVEHCSESCIIINVAINERCSFY